MEKPKSEMLETIECITSCLNKLQPNEQNEALLTIITRLQASRREKVSALSLDVNKLEKADKKLCETLQNLR